MLTTLKKVLGLQDNSNLTGSILEFGGPFAPEGYLDCDGRNLPVGNNYFVALFSVIGTIYGGDGQKTFAVPDLRPFDKQGQRIDWAQAGVPRQVICYAGEYPRRP